jgi:hypothetical protein
MNLKPKLLGAAAAALVVTGVVNLTSEGDKVTFAPAPLIEAVPAPLPPVCPAVKATPKRPAVKPASKHAAAH